MEERRDMQAHFVRNALALAGGLILAVSSPALAQTIAIDVDGVSNGDAFGFAVDGGRDVDGDGVPDFVVGAPQSHPLVPGAGYARVISGASGALLFKFTGATVGDEFGFAVALVGDVDGDGRADIAVGSPMDGTNGTRCGALDVFSGANGARLFRFVGNAGDALGAAVRAAGDYDLDGRADLIVGAPQPGAGNGYALIRSGRDGSILSTYIGRALDDRFGTSVAAAGDVDGDGRVDFIIGAPGADNAGSSSGSARVISGATNAVLFVFDGASANDELGHSVDGAGDVDGDGFGDLVVGAWKDNAGAIGVTPGSASVYSGRDGSVLYHFVGLTADDVLGRTVRGAGDVDGDGYSDFMLGARHDNNGDHTSRIDVRSGRDGELIFTLYGDHEPDDFGLGLAPAGDLDGDGLADILIGATEAYHFAPREGYVRAFLGCSSRIVTYGASCPFAFGAKPKLYVDGCPSPGLPVIFEVTRGLGHAHATLRFGRERAAFARANGCSSLIASLLPENVEFGLGGIGAGAGFGSATWIVPSNLGPHATIDVQAFIEDSSAPGGISATNAIEIRLP